jgi:superfamily I DNA and/or RNA helicase
VSTRKEILSPLAEAEENYLLSRDSEAIRIASDVDDAKAGEFLEKINILNNMTLGDPAKKDVIDALRKKYPRDDRVEYVHREYMSALQRAKARKAKVGEKLDRVRKLIAAAQENSRDEITELLTKAVELGGVDKKVRGLVADVGYKYLNCGEEFTAGAFLEDMKVLFEKFSAETGGKIEKLTEKVARAIAKKDEEARKEHARKVFDRTTDCLNHPAPSQRKLNAVLNDLLRVYTSGTYIERSRSLYLEILERALLIREYGLVTRFSLYARGKIDRNTDDILSGLYNRARSGQVISRLERHFNILDCQVRAEALSVQSRQSGKSRDDNNGLRYDVDSYEILPEGSLKVETVSQMVDVTDDKKEKYTPEVLDAFRRNETYLLTAKDQEDRKIEIFMIVGKREKGHVFLKVNFAEEKNALRDVRELRQPVLIKVSDPSLLRRRNNIGDHIASLQSCYYKGEKASTGAHISDISLGLYGRVPENGETEKVELLDEKIEADPVQKKAVLSCLDKDMPFHLIQGPPGTGKTRVTVELIRQFSSKGKKVLVVSQSNPGIDNLVLKLLALEEEGEDIRFARVGNEELSVDERVRDNWEKRDEILRSMYDEARRGKAGRKGAVVLGTTNGFPSVVRDIADKSISKFYSEYDVVIIEEAGRATLAETLYPLSWLDRSGKAILVGDHKQLPAYGIDQQQVEEAAFELISSGDDEDKVNAYLSRRNVMEYKISLFELLWKNSRYFRNGLNKHLLMVNRRSHPVIAELISSLFYEGKIMPDPAKRSVPVEEDTVRFIDYGKGRSFVECEKKVPGGKSYVNFREACIAVNEIDRISAQELRGSRRYAYEDITVITPYEAQANLIRSLLESKAVVNDIRSGIFGSNGHDVYEKIEKLESVLYSYSEASWNDPDIVNVLAKLKKNKGRLNDKEDISVLEQALSFMPTSNPYKSGRDLSCGDLEDLRIVTVDSVQGAENKVVILSMVRSNHLAGGDRSEIGFLGTRDGRQRLNVALSRAQEKLSIIGDFNHTLTKADPKKTGRWNYNIGSSLKVFRGISEYCNDLKPGDSESRDIGGTKATNQDVNDSIRKYIRKGRVVKLKLNESFFFYKPSYLDQYTHWDNDFQKVMPSVLSENEVRKLRRYIGTSIRSLTGENEWFPIEDVTIGIIMGQTYVSADSEEKFSIMHAGSSTATIWFGEYFLRDLLKDGYNEDAQEIFEHEVKHLVDPFEAVNEHKLLTHEDLRSRVRFRAEKVHARVNTVRFLDDIITAAHDTKDRRKLVLALDLDWLPDRQGVQVLLSALGRLSGKKDIVFIKSGGEELAKKIHEEAGEDDLSNVVVLASEKTLRAPLFRRMKMFSYDKRPFFAQIDPTFLKDTDIGKYHFIRIVEMLRIAVHLASTKYPGIGALDLGASGVQVKRTLDPHVYIFIPEATPLDLGELTELYKAQADILFSA